MNDKARGDEQPGGGAALLLAAPSSHTDRPPSEGGSGVPPITRLSTTGPGATTSPKMVVTRFSRIAVPNELTLSSDDTELGRPACRGVRGWRGWRGMDGGSRRLGAVGDGAGLQCQHVRPEMESQRTHMP